MFRELMKNSLWFRLGLLWVLVIVAATTAPWTNFEPTPTNWQKINWVPYAHIFWGERLVNRDVLQNLVLYMPFGYCYVKSFPSEIRSELFLVGIFACALSLVTEVAQVFQPERYPSVTDVVNNTFGALMGAGFGRWCGIKPEK